MLKWRYNLYLRIGGMQEILNLTYWDFIGLQEVMRENAERASGKPILRDELKPSQKDMIKRLKEMKGDNA